MNIRWYFSLIREIYKYKNYKNITYLGSTSVLEIKCLSQNGIGLCVNFKRRDYNVWLEDVHDDGVHARNLQLKQFLNLSKKYLMPLNILKIERTHLAIDIWVVAKIVRNPAILHVYIFFFLFLRFGRYWIIIV